MSESTHEPPKNCFERRTKNGEVNYAFLRCIPGYKGCIYSSPYSRYLRAIEGKFEALKDAFEWQVDPAQVSLHLKDAASSVLTAGRAIVKHLNKQWDTFPELRPVLEHRFALVILTLRTFASFLLSVEDGARKRRPIDPIGWGAVEVLAHFESQELSNGIETLISGGSVH